VKARSNRHFIIESALIVETSYVKNM